MRLTGALSRCAAREDQPLIRPVLGLRRRLSDLRRWEGLTDDMHLRDAQLIRLISDKHDEQAEWGGPRRRRAGLVKCRLSVFNRGVRFMDCCRRDRHGI
jgi:hypothetical protein